MDNNYDEGGREGTGGWGSLLPYLQSQHRQQEATCGDYYQGGSRGDTLDQSLVDSHSVNMYDGIVPLSGSFHAHIFGLMFLYIHVYI